MNDQQLNFNLFYHKKIFKVEEQHGDDSPTTWNAFMENDMYIPEAVYYVIGWEFEVIIQLYIYIYI